MLDRRDQNDKNTFYDEKEQKNYTKALIHIFFWTCPTDHQFNMLQPLERRRKYIGIILSDEVAHKTK